MVVLLVGCGNSGCVILAQIDLVVVVMLLGGCGIGTYSGCICHGSGSSGNGVAVGSCGCYGSNGGVIMVLVGSGNGGGGSVFGSGGGRDGVVDSSCGSVVCGVVVEVEIVVERVVIVV